MYWIAQVIGLLVVVAVFCATVLNQQRSWTTATTALGQSSSGVALLADMEKAKRRWTMRGYWWTVLVLLLLVAIGVVIGSLVASSRWKVPVVSASQPWIDTMVFSAAVWLIYLLLPGLAALILGPIAMGRGVGLLAARRWPRLRERWNRPRPESSCRPVHCGCTGPRPACWAAPWWRPCSRWRLG